MSLRREDMLTVAKAAEKHHRRPDTVRSLCRLGKIRHVLHPGKGPTGLVMLIYPDSAEAVLGIPA